MINKFLHNKTVHYLHFSSSRYLQLFFINAFLFNLEVIFRLSFPIYVLFTGSLFRFPFYLQGPFFDFHVIYRLLFQFPC